MCTSERDNMSKSATTKRKSYSVHQKLAAVERVKNGDSQAQVARDNKCNESTLRGWLLSEEKLREFLKNVNHKGGLHRKTTRRPEDPKLDQAVYEWFVKESKEGTVLNGPVILEEAIRIQKEIHGKENDAMVSKGWLDRFKKRHGLRAGKKTWELRQDEDEDVEISEDENSGDDTEFSELQRDDEDVEITKEVITVDDKEVSEFGSQLQTYMTKNDLTPEQVYNADEVGVHYRMLPDHPNNYESRKRGKERITFLFCTNQPGTHKLKPLSIGEFRAPRCLHHINMNSLPLYYGHSKNAWMTCSIFREWFHDNFVPDVREHLRGKGLPERAVLLLDCCPAHPHNKSLSAKTPDGQITVLYLPPKTMRKMQPLERGIISTFKRQYYKELLKEMLSSKLSLDDFLKAVDIKQMMHLSATAWDTISPPFIASCWANALPTVFSKDTSDSSDKQDELGFSEEDISLAQKKLQGQLEDDVDLQEYLKICETEEDFTPYNIQMDEDIIFSDAVNDQEGGVTVKSEPAEEDDDDENEEEEEQPSEEQIPLDMDVTSHTCTHDNYAEDTSDRILSKPKKGKNNIPNNNSDKQPKHKRKRSDTSEDDDDDDKISPAEAVQYIQATLEYMKQADMSALLISQQRKLLRVVKKQAMKSLRTSVRQSLVTE